MHRAQQNDVVRNITHQNPSHAKITFVLFRGVGKNNFVSCFAKMQINRYKLQSVQLLKTRLCAVCSIEDRAFRNEAVCTCSVEERNFRNETVCTLLYRRRGRCINFVLSKTRLLETRRHVRCSVEESNFRNESVCTLFYRRRGLLLSRLYTLCSIEDRASRNEAVCTLFCIKSMHGTCFEML